MEAGFPAKVTLSLRGASPWHRPHTRAVRGAGGRCERNDVESKGATKQSPDSGAELIRAVYAGRGECARNDLYVSEAMP